MMNLRRLFVILFIAIFASLVFASVQGTIASIGSTGDVLTDIPLGVLERNSIEEGDMLRVELAEVAIVIPFVRRDTDVPVGTPLARASSGFLLLARSSTSFAERYGADVGSSVVISIVSKGSYIGRIGIGELERTDDRADYDSDEAFANFREVAIGNISHSKLFRTSHPALDSSRSSYAGQLTEEAGVQSIINLSDSDEDLARAYQINSYYRALGDEGGVVSVFMDESLLLAKTIPDGVSLSSLPDLDESSFAVMSLISDALLSDVIPPRLREGLLFMIEKDPPFLVHCVDGKDRTGLTIALLAAIMDATVDEILDDYAQSFVSFYHVVPGSHVHQEFRDIMADMLTRLNSGIPIDNSNVKNTAMRYLVDQVGLTLEQIGALQNKLR
jgi:hypothetical protein